MDAFRDKRLAVAALLGVAVLTWFGVRCVKKVVKGNDFFMHEAGRAIFEGKKIYPVGELSERIPGPEQISFGKRKGDRRMYLYPPAPAVVAAPLAYVPAWMAGTFWYVLKLTLIGATFWLTLRIFDLIGVARPGPIPLAVAFLIVLRFFENDLMNGQVNIVILFLIMSSLYCYVSGREGLAGAFIAAAFTIKQPALLFVAYWGMRFRCKVLIGFGVGLLVFLYLIPGLFVGYPKIHEYNTHWFRSIIYDPGGQSLSQKTETMADAQGESLLGFYSKFLSHSDASSHRDYPVYVNLVDLDPKVVSNLHRATSLLLLAGLFGMTLRRSASERVQAWRVLCEFAAVGALTLLISPISHKAHFVLLFLSAVATAFAAWHLQRGKRFLFGALIVSFILCMLRNDTTTEYGVITITTMIFVATSAYLHWTVTEEELPASDQPALGKKASA